MGGSSNCPPHLLPSKGGSKPVWGRAAYQHLLPALLQPILRGDCLQESGSIIMSHEVLDYPLRIICMRIHEIQDFAPVMYIVSVLHQNKGGIGKSWGRRGWIFQFILVLVEYGHSLIINLSTGSWSANPSLGRIDSVKINPSLLMMTDCPMQDWWSRYLHLKAIAIGQLF